MDRIIKREVETGCEYTLPDYMGDVKRVLYSSASVVPTGRFISDGAIEMSGLVSFEVIYLDSEGKLTSFTASGDLAVKESIDSDGDVDAVMRSVPNGVSVRVIGPRRVALRSMISVALTVSDESVPTVNGEALDEAAPEGLERLTEGINALYSRHHTSGEREYAEEACRLVGVTSDEVEIISTSGRVVVLEATAENGGVRVKGEMIITSIVRTEEQPPFAVKRIIPFDELVEIEGAVPTDKASVSAYLTSQTMGIAEDGDATVLSANAICEFAVSLYDNKSIEIVKDAYLTDRECSSEYGRLAYVEHITSLRADDEVTYRISREELGLSSVREVLTVSAEPRINERKVTDDRIELTGVIRISGIACEISELGVPTYLPFKAEASFNEIVNSSCHIPSEAELECVLTVGEIDCTVEPEYITFSVSLISRVRVLCERSEERLVSFTAAEGMALERSPSEIVVYYPDPDETLYDVSKLHRVKISDVAEKNGISSPAASIDYKATLHSLGVRRVLIP